MTDRVKGFVVTLDEDMREDDAEQIRAALGMVRGVMDVSPVPVVGVDDYMNRTRVLVDLRRRVRRRVEEALAE